MLSGMCSAVAQTNSDDTRQTLISYFHELQDGTSGETQFLPHNNNTPLSGVENKINQHHKNATFWFDSIAYAWRVEPYLPDEAPLPEPPDSDDTVASSFALQFGTIARTPSHPHRDISESERALLGLRAASTQELNILGSAGALRRAPVNHHILSLASQLHLQFRRIVDKYRRRKNRPLKPAKIRSPSRSKNWGALRLRLKGMMQ